MLPYPFDPVPAGGLPYLGRESIEFIEEAAGADVP